MDRRTFTTAVGLGLLIAAGAGRTQQPQTIYRIGFVEAGAASANQHFMDAFMDGLRELGYVPGNNIVVDARWAEGQVEGFRRGLADVIKTRPDVIVSHQLWAPWRRRRRHPRFLWSLLVSPILLAAVWQAVLRGQSKISPGSRAPPVTASSARRFRRSPNSIPPPRGWPSFGIRTRRLRNAVHRRLRRRAPSALRLWSLRCVTSMASLLLSLRCARSAQTRCSLSPIH